jgi:hypothetical protein
MPKVIIAILESANKLLALSLAIMKVVAPLFTFGSVQWWVALSQATHVLLDEHEHYQKMTDRNRYKILGANGSILLSVPLSSGRNQRRAMANVEIANETNWQLQHWRGIVSAYNRSPFFFHYEPLLAPLYTKQWDNLTQFNTAAITWVLQQLRWSVSVGVTEHWQKEYPTNILDLRGTSKLDYDIPVYYQVFSDRLGFHADLSILDALFNLGPQTGVWLRGIQQK